MMSPELLAKFKTNFIVRQKYNASSCGLHAIKFIEDRMAGKTWDDATGYKEWIARHPNQKASDSQDGEREVQKEKKIYKKYL